MVNSTLENFKLKYERVNKFKEKLDKLLKVGQDIGIQFNSELIEKFQKVSFSLDDNEKLKVVLIGGFSEGKTSIAAAWLGKYDPQTMLINEAESTDMVAVYDIDSDLTLIDTPGLFGYKEKVNDQNKIEKYKDITKKYVDEAHIILYVMDSSNPIKDSHKGELFWLFRTLGILNRTVFVLSKFDMVVDLDSNELYNEELKIKKNNVIGRLSEVINLSQEEIKALNIVGVSANPDGEGIEYWLKNIEEFERISKIDTLREATKLVIDRNNGKISILYDTQKVILKEIINIEIPLIREEKEKVDKCIVDLEEQIVKYKRDIVSIEKDIVNSSVEMRRYIRDYFTDLILDARKCNMDNVQAFLEAQIGDDASVIVNDIECKIAEETNSICSNIQKVTIELEAGLRQTTSLYQELGTDGAKFIIRNKELIDNKTIIAIRDGAMALAKKIGIDIGKNLKFKPWQAAKWAKNLKGLLEAIGIALEIWEAWDTKKKEEAFNKSIDTLVKALENMRDDMMGVFKDEGFAEKYFPNYVQLKKDLAEREKALNEQRIQQNNFENWCIEINKLSIEYERIDKM